MREFAAGSLVKHQTLGTGKVVAVEPTALHVFFPKSDTRFAAKLRWPVAASFLTEKGLETDPWLEGLHSFALDAVSGRYALAANFVTQDEAVAAYLAEHPAGFRARAAPRKGAPAPDRAGRWRGACAEWTAAMGGGQSERLLEDGNYHELVRRAVRVAARAGTVPGMVEAGVVREAFEAGDAVRPYFQALFSYLSVPSPARARFDRLAAASAGLGAPADAAWPLITFFPFVAVPARHIVLLQRSAAAGAGRLGCDLGYRDPPSWATYQRLRDLSTRLLEKLGPSGAQDLVDVECFLHATGARRPAGVKARRATVVARTSASGNGRTAARKQRR